MAVKFKLGYKSTHICSAVAPKIGDHFTCQLGKVNANTFQGFINEFSEYLEDKKAILVMDNASWHKAKVLVIPDNIVLVFLPPYSPELNPVERWWKYLKDKVLKNRVIDALEEAVKMFMEFVDEVTIETVRSVCRVDALYC
jgi:hypothetical protein